MRRLFSILFLLSALISGRAQGADEYYVQIYNIIQQADGLANGQQYRLALEKYREARSALDRFQKGNPSWNTSIIRFRIAYLDERIQQLEQKVSAAAPQQPVQEPQQPPAAQAGPAVAVALEAQVNALQEEVQRLETERNKLESKLKEALAVRPAAIDPLELQKAQQRIEALQRENELLKVNVEKLKTQPASPEALAELERKLNEQTERTKTLEQEKKTLQAQLDSAKPESQAALEKLSASLKEQQQMVQRLASEREALQAKLTALQAEAANAGAMKAENELLKKQLAAAEAKAAARAGAATPTRDSDLEAQIASLKSDKDILTLEKTALQNRVRELQASTPAVTQPPTREEARRIRDLEKERDALMKKLAAAERDLADRKGSGRSDRMRQLQEELAGVRQRLQVLEAQKVPYTPEELALFNAPAPGFAAPTESTPPPRKFSASTAGILAEAQKHFAEGRLEQAEENFKQALKEDNSDVITLGNLATVQIERKEYAEAEENIQRALELAPNDAFTVSLLGRLRFLQQRHEEAFEALSRAASLDPKSAEIQNYLGLVLSERGMRAPAESALRKALQLQPNYGSAHQNLAVVYLTQNPPLVELARYHYNKSLSAGTPRNEQLEKLIESKRNQR